MTTVSGIESFLYTLAPEHLKCQWDNVGLLVGDGEREVRRVLVSLDITESVVQEAAAAGAQLIVSHHPVMNCAWHKVQSIRTDNRQGRILTGLIENRIAAICMHTNLDVAQGGVNDALAQRLGLSELQLLDEEQIGRIGYLDRKIPLAEFLPYVVKLLGSVGLRYRDAGKPVQKVAVGGGACGEYISCAIAAGCDTFVTSDLRYHDFLECDELNLIDAGHFPTEDVICPVLVKRLQDQFSEISVFKSASHREVIQYYKKEF